MISSRHLSLLVLFESVYMGILPGKDWCLFLRSEAARDGQGSSPSCRLSELEAGVVFSNHLSTGEFCAPSARHDFSAL
jgi:hypothetical protein